MDYRKFGETYYVRLDRDDEVISSILMICREEGIHSATFSGIGGYDQSETVRVKGEHPKPRDVLVMDPQTEHGIKAAADNAVFQFRNTASQNIRG